MDKEIFISYSRKNLTLVAAIKAEIEEATGTECWMDVRNIPASSLRFSKDIVDGINACRVFLFMLSKESQESEWALNELLFAKEKVKSETQKDVIILNIDGCQLNDEFRLVCKLMNIIMWNDLPQKENMFNSIRQLTGKDIAKKADPTSADEQFQLGNDYYFGQNGRKQDYVEAAKWYHKAAEQGKAKAQFNLGVMY
ncbi:MAG: toll/interleukin-1 receptor domain-containing protein, partial [Bacteroidaceae bacterium]|nr:toll/interleukin-1 receptor domain-containing protein [Bacteroidaceae bacterium]